MPFDDPALPRALVGGGGGPPSGGDEDPPASPTGLTATAGNTQVLLGWSDNTDLDLNHYRVYRATVSGGPYTLIATLSTSEFPATGLVNGTTYYFVVTAVDDFGYESAESSQVSAIPAAPPGADTTPPAVPAGLAALPGDRQITVNWNNVADSDLSHYKVYRGATSGGSFTLLATRTVSDYLDVGLTNGTQYWYKVSSVDTTGNESALTSAVIAIPAAVVVDTTPPPTPTGLTATAGHWQVTLNWDNSPAGDFKEFRVFRSLASAGPFIFLITRIVSDYINGTLTNGTTYWYKVSAVDLTGNESAQSAAVSATPFAPPVLPPGGGDGHAVYADRQVTINVGDNAQTVINANSSGTIYGFAPGGNHLSHGALGLFTPKANDKFVGQIDGSGNPTSFLIGDWNQTQFGGGVTSPFTGTLPTGVEMIRLNFSLFASANAQAAMNSGTNWTYWKCWGHHCKSAAFRVGPGGLISGGKCYDNGQCGVFAHHPAVGGVIEHMEIYNNNLQGWNDPDWEAGGLKLTGPQGLLTFITTRNCHVHHNNGSGIWYDQDGGYHTIEDNTSEFNTRPGIHYEICGNGPTWIRRNTVRYNGGACDLYISNSRGLPGDPIVVEDNKVYNHATTGLTSHASIWMVDSAIRPVRLGYVTFRRNRVARAPRSGVSNFALGNYGVNGADGSGAPGIVINDNDYFTDIVNAWQWGTVSKTWAQWQALGYDTIGTRAPYQTP